MSASSRAPAEGHALPASSNTSSAGYGQQAGGAPTRVIDAREALRLNNFDMLVECGLLMAQAGEAGEALMLLRQACVVKPKHDVSSVHYTLARLATNPRERREHAERYTDLQPSDTYGWLMLGNVLDTVGDSEAALVAYRKGHEADPAEYRGVVSSCRMLSRLGRDAEALELAEAAVASGALNDKWQRPSHFVRGLSATSWHDVSTWRVRRVLEQNFETIRGEIMTVFEDGSLQRQGADDTEGLMKSGSWKELNVLFQGITQVQNSKLCPKTVDLIEREIPEAASMVRGAVKISVLEPGTVIKPHHGPSNTRMRTHLGVRIPPGCYIRAGDPEDPSTLRQWEEGKLLCFDDSYRHEVWHEGTEYRIILTVDVWHPELDHHGRIAACETEHQKQVYMARYQIGKDGVGWD